MKSPAVGQNFFGIFKKQNHLEVTNRFKYFYIVGIFNYVELGTSTGMQRQNNRQIEIRESRENILQIFIVVRVCRAVNCCEVKILKLRNIGKAVFLFG